MNNNLDNLITHNSHHWMIKHTGCDTSPYEYVYHLSDEMRHDFAFTFTILCHLLEVDKPSTICLKSENCAAHCKSKHIFQEWQPLAKESGMSVIVYYGVSGHGMGFVDATSGFGVKGPLRRSVITSNFCYGNSLDIYNHLTETLSNDDKKHCFVLDPETIAKRRNDKQPLPIKLCREKHMISFSPDGSLQTKINICWFE